ncbi:hypothetical protein KKG41_00080 [Patescibacteria group bacterium]|nr:hypothetical protein [Patescibacteria group bacterium]MBU1890566.1 hypothetical protein [Patescibacteria group bacterium]
MKNEQEIKDKIDELDSEKDDLENEFQEALEDESVDEDSDEGEKIRLEFDEKVESFEKQIELLEWVLSE